MLKILKTHSILYVEDEPMIQANIVEYLEAYFNRVYVASDGKEALKLYNFHYPDILLLDINLPLINGLTVAQEVRKKNSSVKIIVLTAYTDTKSLLVATELKLTKYLVKPIAPKAFKETMYLLAKELSANPSIFIHLTSTCIWNKEEERLRVDNRVISFTQKEHKLFKLLIKHRKETVLYEDIMATVWEDIFEQDISFDSVKNQVSKLRKKLPDNLIKSVYSQGYVLL